MGPIRKGLVRAVVATTGLLLFLSASATAAPASLPENLARKARITANSEHSGQYLAKFVADGKIPDARSQQDLGLAWCVNGNTHRQGAELRFEWDPPVTLAEIVYYGRTAWFLEECWKDYELYLDDATIPALTGQLRMVRGPQRLTLPSPTRAAKASLRFTSSFGGLNPGASEIQVFPAIPSQQALARLAKPDGPPVDVVNVDHLRKLIQSLAKASGPKYAQAGEHLARLARLAQRAAQDEDVEADLAQLQREVLLFEVERFVVIQRYEIDSTHVYTYHNEGFRAGGGLYLASFAPSEPKSISDLSTLPRPCGMGGAQLSTLLPTPAGEILDCDLSYDGQVVLFSWREKETEGYHLWTIRVDGAGLTQLTRGEWHDYNGCWLPDGGIAFVSSRSPQFAYCWNSPVGVVHRMDADGGKVRRLSANYLNDFTPYPLENGRLIYSRWEYVDKPAIPIQSLWTINPDGTGLAGYYGNRVISPGTFMEARSVPGTDLILCTMTGHNGSARGAIGLIDRKYGVNAQAAIQNLTPDVPVPPVDKGDGNFWGAKPYSNPHPLDARRFLVSAHGPLLVRTFDGTCQSLVLPRPEKGLQWVCAQPVRPRVRPPVIPPQLTEPEPMPVARLYLQNVYEGLEPAVKRGEIKRLRVVRELPKTVRINPDKRAFGFQFPVISAGATYAGKQVLGEVEVAPDGSAYFEVPAGIPIYFMALDAQGRAVQRMRSFTHLMPGEVQGCIGCHESRGQVARPRLSPAALDQSAQPLTPPEWGANGFAYAAIVQPVLDRYCAECHAGAHPQGKVDLSGDQTDYFNVSYETLARGRRQSGEAQWDNPYVNWIPSYNGFETNILSVNPKSWGSPRSKLADLVLANHPDRDGKPRYQMDEASRRRLLAWIDLNVPYYGSSETTHPDNPGSRRIYPAALDKTLADVAARRCAQCHQEGKIPRPFWTRITHPHLNSFLQAPLAKAAGGTGACGQAVFSSATDPDYAAILQTFQPVLAGLRELPRTDMPGAISCSTVNRSCK
jgi:hypothetical protein